MLRQFIAAAMDIATYEIIDDGTTFYGAIPGFEGVYADAPTLERCRTELEEVLEEWVLFRVSRGLPLPSVGGLELNIRKVS
jgi:predicted RNase H-like HicB family nuclease